MSPPSATVFGMAVKHRWILVAATSERREDADEHPVLAALLRVIGVVVPEMVGEW